MNKPFTQQNTAGAMTKKSFNPSPSTLALAVLLMISSASGAGTPIDRTVAIDPLGTVDVSNVAGSVTVTGWERNEVAISGTLGKGVERLDVNTDGKATRITVVLPSNAMNVEDTVLKIQVPRKSSLAVNTVSADVTVRDLTASQRLQTVSGDVTTQIAAEAAELRTVSGDIEVTGSGPRGVLEIASVSGDIRAMRVAGEVNVTNVSGDMLLGLGAVSRSRIRTTSGDVTMAAALDPGARVDIEGTSSDIKYVSVGPEGGQFDLATFSGDVISCLGPRAGQTDRSGRGSSLQFSHGRASARVRIKSLSGDINVCDK